MFTMTFWRTQPYPVDLYFLMAISDSTHSLTNAHTLGRDLSQALEGITASGRIGETQGHIWLCSSRSWVPILRQGDPGL